LEAVTATLVERWMSPSEFGATEPVRTCAIATAFDSARSPVLYEIFQIVVFVEA
jgi:hypothetical protein